MIQITEIAFFGYPVRNVTRARTFYERVLRLRKTSHFKDSGRHWIEYDIGAATLAISNMYADRWKPSSQGPVVALEVADFDRAISTLRKKRVRFLVAPTDNGTCNIAIVRDPDGNAIEVHQRKPTS